MEDSKLMKDNNYEQLSVSKLIVLIIGIIAICCAFYCLWFFCFLGHPVTTKQIVFEFLNADKINNIENPDSMLNIINKKDFEELKNLTQNIIETNKDISKKIKRSEYLSVSNLNGFYAALFTFMAVIAGISGFVGWKSIRDLQTRLRKFTKIETDVEFLKERDIYVQWIEDRFKDISNQNIDKLKLTQDDKDKFNRIKNYVLKINNGDCWLALIYAYQLIFRDKKNQANMDIAKSSMEAGEIKLLCTIERNNSYLKAQFYHIYGQLFFQYYLLKSKEYNLFNSNNKELKVASDQDIEFVINCLKESSKKYKKLLDDEKQKQLENFNRNETLGNIALNRIELYKIYRSNNAQEPEKCLKEAQGYLNDIGKSNLTFNQIWDYHRLLYYMNDLQNKFNPTTFKNDIKDHIHEIQEQKEDKQFFIQQIKNEQIEFDGNGFPGDINIINDLRETL